MPASVYVRFDAPEGVPATPRRLHAALSSVLDLPPGQPGSGRPVSDVGTPAGPRFGRREAVFARGAEPVGVDFRR